MILDHGMRAMLEKQEDVFYYVTLMNENYAQPSLPEGVSEDIVKGLYRYSTRSADQNDAATVRLIGSGTILMEVIAASELLASDWNVASEIWSATSFTELARDANEVERWNRLHPGQDARQSHVAHCLPEGPPIIAASDYLRAVPQLIAAHVPADYTVLGTDGFGRSDTRSALRSFFEIDRFHIVLAALTALARQGKIERSLCQQAIDRYEIAADAIAPWMA